MTRSIRNGQGGSRSTSAALSPQRVRVAGEVFEFAAGERIHTEYSYKYDLDEFHHLAGRVGFYPERAWTDARELFSVHFLRVA